MSDQFSWGFEADKKIPYILTPEGKFFDIGEFEANHEDYYIGLNSVVDIWKWANRACKKSAPGSAALFLD